MTDPFSLATGAIGLVKAACEISELLVKFTRGVRDAPKQASAALDSVNEMSPILHQLQQFLCKLEDVDVTRTSQLDADQVLIIISGCVRTYSELHLLLKDIVPEYMNMFDRARWTRKESEVQRLIERLQTHKASLSLLLIVFTSARLLDVKNTVEHLSCTVDRFYQDMKQRLPRSDFQAGRRSPLYDAQEAGDSDDAASFITTRENNFVGDEPAAAVARFAFEPDLRKSRPYRRIEVHDRLSVISADEAETKHLSTLTGVSLAEISNASMINLLVSRNELSNAHAYEVPSSENFEPAARYREDSAEAWAAPYAHEGVLTEFPGFILSSQQFNSATESAGFTARARSTNRAINRPILNGYLRLTYYTGEIVDVIAIAERIWLARRPSRSFEIGWILPEDFTALVCRQDLARLKSLLPNCRSSLGWRLVRKWKGPLGIGVVPGLFPVELDTLSSAIAMVEISTTNENHSTDSTGGSKLSELLSDALAQRQLIQDLACILGGTERDTKGKARHEEKLSSLWGSGPYTFVTEVIARPISSSRSKKAAANGSSSFIGIAATPQPNDVFHPHYLMAAAGGRLPTPNRTYEGEMRGIGQGSQRGYAIWTWTIQNPPKETMLYVQMTWVIACWKGI
ncbi:MAG: hypothetical protein MMC23_007758 [Stictis urceolatum]|nr:hypothetical protein [Stictis urceolata]